MSESNEFFEAYVHRRQVFFGETDAARIVYTGEIPKYGLEAVEAWFLDRLGVSWYDVNVESAFGTPFVHLSFDFRHPLTPRHPLFMTVLLEKAGRTSLTLRVEGRSDGRLCFEARFVTVFVDPSRNPMPVPERCREATARELDIASRAR